MRNVLLRIVVGFVTFTVGISFVFLTSKLSMSHNESVIIVEPAYVAEVGVPRFGPIARGCGNGYVQTYETDDGQFVDEGVVVEYSTQNIRRDLRKWIRASKQIVKRVPRFRNHRGEVGDRTIILNRAVGEGKESVSIVFYDGGDSYRFIDAPTLDLALEFEQYLISIDFRSPF